MPVVIDPAWIDAKKERPPTGLTVAVLLKPRRKNMLPEEATAAYYTPGDEPAYWFDVRIDLDVDVTHFFYLPEVRRHAKTRT